METGNNGAVAVQARPPDIDPLADDGGEIITVDDRFRACRWHHAERQKLRDRARAEIERVEQWLERAERGPTRKIEWHTEQIRQAYRGSGQTKPDRYPHGTVRLQRGRERVEITDIDALAPQFFHAPAAPRPDLLAIRKHVQRNGGECPDGADIVRGEDVIVVEVHDDAE